MHSKPVAIHHPCQQIHKSFYAKFKVKVVNDMQKGIGTSNSSDLNKIYVLASRRVVLCTNKDTGGGTFASIDQENKRQDSGKN
jgi:hypothetical protein